MASGSTTARKLKPWPPRWLTKVPAADIKRGDGDRYAQLAEATCRIVKDSVAAPAGSLIELRPWQLELNRRMLARRSDFRMRHRVALIGVPRKNGKSGHTSTIGVGGLVLQPAGGEIYSCAADRDQAKIVFDTAKKMVDQDPVLSSLLKTYRDVIENPTTGTTYKALSSEAFTKEGKNPTLVLFDELHAQPNRELWDVMSLATGARPDPLIAAITTAGQKYDRHGKPTICYELYQYGVRLAQGELDDPTFFFAWWEPQNPNADWRDPKVHAEANPGYDDLVRADDFTSVINTTPESEFRTKRLNQWVSTYSAWFPTGSFEANRVTDEIPDGAEVVLTFDGSFNNDSTGLEAVSIPRDGGKPRVQVVKAWERTAMDPPEWTVNIADVEQQIREACLRWDVKEIICDPYRWARSMQALELEGLPVVAFPQSPERMVPATATTYELVMSGGMEYFESTELERHVGAASLKVGPRGGQLTKESKSSLRKIDLAVCMVMGIARAMWWSGQRDNEFIF